tara:strand:+ start:969 stop:1238 length:270 start_codon:yes stop_codon:yes gene_type:complete
MTVNKMDSVGNAQPVEPRNAWGYPDKDTLRLTPSQTQSLRRVIAMYMGAETQHWEESDEPAEHVYHDLVTLRWAIRTHDSVKDTRSAHE